MSCKTNVNAWNRGLDEVIKPETAKIKPSK